MKRLMTESEVSRAMDAGAGIRTFMGATEGTNEYEVAISGGESWLVHKSEKSSDAYKRLERMMDAESGTASGVATEFQADGVPVNAIGRKPTEPLQESLTDEEKSECAQAFHKLWKEFPQNEFYLSEGKELFSKLHAFLLRQGILG